MKREITFPQKKTLTQLIMVRLRVVTPIYGGAAKTRQIDHIDVIRPASVRGHLRFWWRALHARDFDSAAALYAAERAIWGGAAISDEGGRSNVEIRITIHVVGDEDRENIRMGTADGYALFPARAQGEGKPDPRRKPGTEFDLELRMKVGFQHAGQVRDALQAWILFGGYGGRTRRGLGSLTIVTSNHVQLPTAATPDAIAKLFARDPFAPRRDSNSVASLGGAKLLTRPAPDEMRAWFDAIGWLRDFRQGTKAPVPLRARQQGSDGHPSISNWPEPDKIRHLCHRPGAPPWAHPPRHDDEPAWPRADFGLPIVGRFRQKYRDKPEPPPFEIVWHDGKEFRNRLASALILKLLPLTDNRFAAMALWLDRAPPKGEVGLRDNPKSRAPFGRLTAPNDKVHFPALQGKKSLQEAFFDWIESSTKRSPSPHPSNRQHRRGNRR